MNVWIDGYVRRYMNALVCVCMYVCNVCMYVAPLLFYEYEVLPALPGPPWPILAGGDDLGPVHTYIQAPHTTAVSGEKLNLLKPNFFFFKKIRKFLILCINLIIHTYIHSVHTLIYILYMYILTYIHTYKVNAFDCL